MQLPDPPKAGIVERLQQRLIMLRGILCIAWNQMRRRMGKSYYATTDPWVAGLFANEYTVADQRRTFRLPAWNEGNWAKVGSVTCLSGRLVITDPVEFPSDDPFIGVVEENVPIGAFPIELQRFDAGRGYGRLVLRARVLWGGVESADFQYLGAAGVDLGMLSIADAAQTSQLTHEQTKEAGFDPLELMSVGSDYACVDPLGRTNCFLHVFRSGFGDGTYPVFRINCQGCSSGILIDMTGLLEPSEFEQGVDHGGES